MADFLKEALQLEEQVVAWRRHIHQNAEIGCELPKTATYVESVLDSLEIQHRRFFGCGVAAWIGEGERTVMLRADMDALPGNETSGLPYACSTGAVHACGHDIHTSMLLGAAKLLQAHRNELHGRVVLMFQPGEETGDGCLEMIEAGVLENPAPDAAMGLHVDAGAPLGQIAWGQGPTFCSNDVFILTVQGQSCHGARPHQGKDALNCAAHLILALETLIAREADPSQTDILTVCSIESSSKAFNIFPENVVLKGSLRTYNNDQRDYLLARLQEVCEYTAKTFGCQCQVEFEASMNAVVLDEPMEEEIKGYLRETLKDEAHLTEKPIRKMGSDDFAGVTCRLPSAYFFVGAGADREHPYPYIQHNSKVVFNEECLPLGAAALAGCAEGWLKNHAK